jgi:hypothetical protein
MMTIRAHFDGKVFVPDETVDVPVGMPLQLQVQPVPPGTAAAADLLSPVIVGLNAALSQAIASDPELAADNM